MEFANDDDDDIYDGEHRLKWPELKKYFGTILNTKKYFTIFSI